MNIVIEKRSIPAYGGISRDATYVCELLAKVILEKNSALTINEKTSPKAPRKIISIAGLIFGGVKVNLKEEEIYFEALLSGFRMKNSSSWHIIRVHDVFPLSNPEWFNKRSVLAFRQSMSRAIQGERTVFVCNSVTTKNNILELFPKMTGSTIVIYCNPQKLPMMNSKNCSCLGCQYSCNRESNSFLLAVGTVEPRKNYEAMIEISNHKEVETDIVVVGKPGWKSKRTQKLLRNSERITWLSDCCDFALDQLYRNCAAFISTSLNEGFNLPAGEARLYGKRLILPKLPIYDELYGQEYESYKNDLELLRHIKESAINKVSHDYIEIDYNDYNVSSLRQLVEHITVQK
jgi:glycosyltransferase involved in cell wall biosynthesis